MYKVIGYKKVKYTNKAGNEVRGIRLFVVHDEPEEGLTGYSCESLWLRETIDYTPRLDENVRVYYNKYGGIDSVVRA